MAKKHRRKSSRRKSRRVSGDPSLAPAVVSGTRRRRKHTTYGKVRKHKRRVKGMGAMGEANNLMLGLGLGVATAVLTRIAGKKFLAGKEKIIAGANLLIGAGAVIKGKKPMLKGFGMGMAAIGAYQSATEFGVISGMEEFIHGIGAGADDTMKIEMNGVDLNSTNIINGTDQPQPSIVSGDEMSGDEMNGAMPSVVG